MKNVYASIITIGDELLIGQVVDTNSSWMAQELNKAGIALKRRVAVGDSKDEIVKILDEESKYSEIILMTGGLGPTSDDLTKDVLNEYFGGKLIENTEALDNVKYLFEKVFKRPVTAVNIQQAQVPDICEVIQNKRGTAPGMIFRKVKNIYVSMPGVPYEMKGMMENNVIPLLKNEFQLPAIVHRTLLTAGIGESALAEVIKDFEDHLPGEIKLAYLPSYGMVRLRLSASGFDQDAIEKKVNEQFDSLKIMVNEYIVTDADNTMPVVIGKLLQSKNKKMATAESCTGGYVSHLITSVPGSSAYYEGSVISYSNAIKKSLLDVKEQTLSAYGAVSEEVVIEMLQGLLKHINADYGIAISGIMGPGGGTKDKPAGTVWIAVGSSNNYKTTQLQLRFTRDRNIEITGMMALNFLRKFILSE